MIEKRFWILNVLTKSSGIKDGDKLLSFDEVVYLLNDLSDENEQLKKENEKLRKENQALKDANDGLTGTIAHFDLDEVMMK